MYGTSRDLSKYSDFDDFKLLSLDVREPRSIRAAIEELITEQGRIDVLINNAGVGITGPLEEIPRDEIENHFNVNLFGPIEMMKSVLPSMRRQKSGLIINITSIAGYMGLPYRSIYSASKAGLEMITESIRMETKDFGVRITNLAPGDFATNIAAGRYHVPLKEDSSYRDAYRKTLDIMNEHVDSGKDPDLVAKKVYGIISDPNPRIHYKVGGWLQKYRLDLNVFCPIKCLRNYS